MVGADELSVRTRQADNVVARATNGWLEKRYLSAKSRDSHCAVARSLLSI